MDFSSIAIRHQHPPSLCCLKTHLKLPHSVSGWFFHAVRRCQKIDTTFAKVTPHDLCHTAASLAISAGANVKAEQRCLGMLLPQ